MKLYIIIIILVLLVLLVLFYNFQYNREIFNIFDSNKIYDKETCYINKPVNEYTNNILNSIFIDDRNLANKNNDFIINKDYKNIGFAINPYYNSKYYIFEKYYKNNLYKYILINDSSHNEQIDHLQHLPPRDKIFLNDIIYFKNYGYYKIIL